MQEIPAPHFSAVCFGRCLPVAGWPADSQSFVNLIDNDLMIARSLGLRRPKASPTLLRRRRAAALRLRKPLHRAQGHLFPSDRLFPVLISTTPEGVVVAERMQQGSSVTYEVRYNFEAESDGELTVFARDFVESIGMSSAVRVSAPIYLSIHLLACLSVPAVDVSYWASCRTCCAC